MEKQQEILDMFGKIVVEQVRDPILLVAMNIAKGTTKNPIHIDKYKLLSTLSDEQKESICDLLSETITATIFKLLNMFEANDTKIKLLLNKDGCEYDLTKISEVTGGEIAFMDEDGWIQKYSKLGRFV